MQSGDFSDLFTSASSAWIFGSKVSWRIFSGNRNRAQLEAAKAIKEQAFIEYDMAVNQVLEDVESNITRYVKDAQALDFVTEAMEIRHKEMQFQSMRHESGLTDSTVVAESRTAWLDAKWNQLGQQVVLLTRVVAVYKSLGGGWGHAAEMGNYSIGENSTPASQ